MSGDGTSIDGGGKLHENIAYFARALRDAGIKVGPSSVVDASRAVQVAGITSRDDFYWTLHSVLINRREDHAVFDHAFWLFWRSRELVEKMLQMFSPQMRKDNDQQKSKAGQTRASQALFQDDKQAKPQDKPELEVDASLTYSGDEVLRGKDFAQMTVAEMEQAREAMSKLKLAFMKVATRRYRVAGTGKTFDFRRTMRSSVNYGGDLVLPKFKQPKHREPPIVILADISGSMSQYSRIFLHFFHSLSENNRNVHTFLFGTRLTNVSRQLHNKDIDEAIADCSDAVEDWSGGTRIGETLEEFNRLWSRRVLGQGAVVLLVTDGLERSDDGDLLAKEIDRLHRSCRRLIWLNPLLRFEGFSPQASGIRTILPNVDEFRPVHSLNSLSDLCNALGGQAKLEHMPKYWLKRGVAGNV